MIARRDIWAVVPVKALGEAKSRLGPQLSAPVRETLARAMLEDVLDALVQVRGLAGLIVVTVDPLATSIASLHGAIVYRDGATEGHTAAVMAAAKRLQSEHRGGMLTVPSDIPAVNAAEIEALLGRHRETPAFTIVPAHDGRGSNAIVMSPPAAVALAFGGDSFGPHVTAARRAGIEPTIVTGLTGIARDVDDHDDVVALLETRRSVRARHVLVRDVRARVVPAGTDWRQRGGSEKVDTSGDASGAPPAPSAVASPPGGLVANVHTLDPSGNDARRVELMQRIVQLRLEHRDLDTALERLSDQVDYDAIQLTRLKRRKLLLKDQITWLERELDPDVRA